MSPRPCRFGFTFPTQALSHMSGAGSVTQHLEFILSSYIILNIMLVLVLPLSVRI